MGEQGEEIRIGDETQYQEALTTLSRRDRPHPFLRRLMNAFEGYRQARKLGWSRPWNKYDLINFQSFKLALGEDRPYVDAGLAVLRAEWPALPAEVAAFIDELVADEDLMGFVFVHEYSPADGRFEGATLSLGRKQAKRYRDRLDLIVESEVVDGRSTGLSRLRLYVDPYEPGRREPLFEATIEAPASAAAQDLFTRLSALSWDWVCRPDRIWDHWTSAYIDYFGPRAFALQDSYFHLPEQLGGRQLPAAR